MMFERFTDEAPALLPLPPLPTGRARRVMPPRRAPGPRRPGATGRYCAPGPRPSGHIPFTPAAKMILELTLREAVALHDSHIGVEHVALDPDVRVVQGDCLAQGE